MVLPEPVPLDYARHRGHDRLRGAPAVEIELYVNRPTGALLARRRDPLASVQHGERAGPEIEIAPARALLEPGHVAGGRCPRVPAVAGPRPAMLFSRCCP